MAAEMPILEVTFTAPTARTAISEGAHVRVSVTAPPDVIALGHREGVPVIPGAVAVGVGSVLTPDVPTAATTRAWGSVPGR